MPHVRVEVQIHPTESPAKVEAALRNLFPDLAIEHGVDRLVGTASRLERLRELIRNQKIRDTARGQLMAGRRGNRTVVRLNKQAAHSGVVNFAIGSPLGDVVVEIEDPDLIAVIDYVAESTVEPKSGRPTAS